jgi:two-component system, NarL family, invasion response regulator UvrY
MRPKTGLSPIQEAVLHHMPRPAERHPRPVAVLTVDDQAVFRKVARDVIDATPGFETVGEAGSGEEALALVASKAPELVLMDIRMPEMDGVETARRICRSDPAPVIVLVSAEDDDVLAERLESAGAVAFVRKQELCPSRLRALWAAHGAAAGAA